MKKYILSVVLTALSFLSFSQTTTYGIKAGVNLAKFNHDIGNLQDVGVSSDMLTTFQAGAFVDLKFGDKFSIQPALLFTGKGSTQNSYGSEGVISETETNIKLYYLQVPVNLLYHIPISGHNIYLGGGPFLSYGLSGKVSGSTDITVEGNTTTTKFDDDIKFGTDSEGDIQRTDYGITTLAGITFSNGLLINLNYDFGLVNIQNNNYSSQTFSLYGKVKTRVFGVSVGYTF